MTLTAENTAIVLDSTADFPQAPERFPNWRVVPLYVLFGDAGFRDYVELTPEEFYARLRTADVLPTTSQPTPGDFLATYEELSGYERIYSLHLSSALSGTYQSATTAAAELGEKVRVVDLAEVRGRRQTHDGDVRTGLQHGPCRLHPVEPRQPVVRQYDVRLVRAHDLGGRGAVTDRGDDLDVGLQPEQQLEGLAEHLVVFHEDEADRLGHRAEGYSADRSSG